MTQILQKIIFLPKAIKISYFKSLKGQENFWIVFFGWGVGLYVASYLAGWYTLIWAGALDKVLLNGQPHAPIDHTLIYDLIFIPIGIVGILGLTLIFIYPFVAIYSLFKCTKKELKYILGTLILSIIFLAIQLAYFPLIAFGVLIFVSSSLIGGLLGIIIVVTVMVRTFKVLKQK